MTTYVPQDAMKLLIAVLPKELKAANGNGIVIAWRDAPLSEPLNARVDGTVARGTRRASSQSLKSTTTEGTATQVDVIAFATGTLDYQVTERDIASITSITGTSGGSPRTFLSGTDYEIATSEEYMTPDIVRWKSGGTLPDNATNFTVTYAHRQYDEKRVSYDYPSFTLQLRVSSLATGELGATSPAEAARLVEELLDSLEIELNAMKGQKLDAGAVLSLKGCLNLGIVGVAPGDDVMRGVLEVELARRREFVVGTTGRIGHAVPSIEIE